MDKAIPKMNAVGAKAAPPSKAAEVIWKAATDGSWKLRYVVGADAKRLLVLRTLVPNSTYQAIVRSQVF